MRTHCFHPPVFGRPAPHYNSKCTILHYSDQGEPVARQTMAARVSPRTIVAVRPQAVPHYNSAAADMSSCIATPGRRHGKAGLPCRSFRSPFALAARTAKQDV